MPESQLIVEHSFCWAGRDRERHAGRRWLSSEVGWAKESVAAAGVLAFFRLLCHVVAEAGYDGQRFRFPKP
jgi:hypothetical protein